MSIRRLLAAIFCALVVTSVEADDLSDIRSQAGARLFRAFLSAVRSALVRLQPSFQPGCPSIFTGTLHFWVVVTAR
jgi:hypothetical protein